MNEEPMQITTRRNFLKATAGAAIAMGTPWSFTTCRGSVQKPSPEAKEQVAAIRGDNLDSITRDAIDALGGIRTVVNKG
jgi:hypothetical protein